MTERAGLKVGGAVGEVSGVLFDLDDTLIDRRGAFRDWAMTMVRGGLSPDSSMNAECIVDFLVALDDDGFTPRGAFFEIVRRRFSVGERPTHDLIARYYRAMVSLVRRKDGSDGLIELLGTMGIPFGVVTNGGPHQMDKAAAAGLTPSARCVLVSDEVGTSKPNVEIFARAADCLGLRPDEIVFVGDQPRIDVLGAHSCGMRTVWLTNGHRWPHPLPNDICDLAVESLAELVSG